MQHLFNNECLKECCKYNHCRAVYTHGKSKLHHTALYYKAWIALYIAIQNILTRLVFQPGCPLKCMSALLNERVRCLLYCLLFSVHDFLKCCCNPPISTNRKKCKKGKINVVLKTTDLLPRRFIPIRSKVIVNY